MISGEIPFPFQLGHGGNGILLLHGFCGSSLQLRYLAQGIHENGYTVSVPLLPGHGTTLRDMCRSTYLDWLTCARIAYTSLREECSSVSVVGHSMGGVLALLLAEEYPVTAVITLAAPMRLKGARSLLAPFAAPVSWLIPYLTLPEDRQIHPDDFLSDDHIGYDGLPLARVRDLCWLMRRARRDLYAITAPLLAVQSRDDLSVSASSPYIILSGVSSAVRERLTLSESGHLIPLGPERKELLAALLSFLERNTRI